MRVDRKSALRHGLMGILAALLLSNCVRSTPSEVIDTAEEFNQLCSPPRQSFGRPLNPESLADSSINARYGGVCKRLERQEGLEFGPGQLVYACRAFLPRMHDQQATQAMDAFEQVFGKRWHVDSFHPAASDPDDLRPRSYYNARQSIDAATFNKQIPIDTFSLYMGIYVTFVLLTDSEGTVQQTLTTRDDLNQSLHGISTLEGAFTFLEWREFIGMTDMPIKPQCTARTVSSDGKSWTFKGIKVQPNCQPTRERDLVLSRSGNIKVLSDKAINQTRAMCVD